MIEYDFEFGFDKDIVKRYTQGGCFALASELHRITGWNLIRLGDVHTAVTVNDYVIDVDGVTRRSAWETKWQYFAFEKPPTTHETLDDLMSFYELLPDAPTRPYIKQMIYDVKDIAQQIADMTLPLEILR